MGREALESSSAVFQTAAWTISATNPKEKGQASSLRHLALQASSHGSCSVSQARRVSGKAIRPWISRTPGQVGFQQGIKKTARHRFLVGYFFDLSDRLTRVVHLDRRESRRLVREKNGIISGACADSSGVDVVYPGFMSTFTWGFISVALRAPMLMACRSWSPFSTTALLRCPMHA